MAADLPAARLRAGTLIPPRASGRCSSGPGPTPPRPTWTGSHIIKRKLKKIQHRPT